MSDFRAVSESNERFAWMFGPAETPAGPTSRQEFEEACQFALSNWRVLQVISPRLRRWAGDGYERHALWRLVDELALALRILGRLRLTLLRRIAGVCDLGGIPYALLKGTALGLTVYESPALRVGYDIDIGVPGDFLQDFKQAVYTLGFEPGQWLADQKVFCKPDLAERAAVEADHYELGFLVRRQVLRNLPEDEESVIRKLLHTVPTHTWHLTADGRLGCYLTLDVHHGLTRSISVTPLVYSSAEVSHGGTSFRVASNAWALFHLILKLYLEGVNSYNAGAYQYADLTRLVARASETDINELLALLTQHRLQAAGFYTLRRLGSNFGMEITPALRAFLHCAGVPPKESWPQAENDFGDMWPKLWGRR